MNFSVIMEKVVYIRSDMSSYIGVCGATFFGLDLVIDQWEALKGVFMALTLYRKVFCVVSIGEWVDLIG